MVTKSEAQAFADRAASFLPTEIAARRMISQFLAPSAARPITPTDPAHTAELMLATQGQNYVGGLTGLHLRAGRDVRFTGKNTTDLDTAMRGGKAIVRTWSQRGTIHFLHPKNFWIVALCGYRATSDNMALRAGRWDLDESTYQQIHDDVVAYATRLRSRADIRGIVAAHGVEPVSGVASSVLRHLGASARLVQGSKIGQHDSFIQVEKLILAAARRKAEQAIVNPERAISTLLQSFMETRGPATISDFTWWSGLPKTSARKAVDSLVARGKLLEVQWGGDMYYLAPWHIDVTDDEVRAALEIEYFLPPFDEFYMSYTNRDVLFAPGVDPTMVLTKNGLSWESYLSGGQIQGRAE